MRWVLRKDLVGDTSIHEVGALRVIATSARIAFVSGFTWGAAALAALSMMWCGLGAWIVFPTLLSAVFVVALLVSGARAALERDEWANRIRLPSPDWFSDSAVQALARRLTAARMERERVERQSPRGPAFDVAPVRQGAAEIERRVIVIAARAEYVASFLSSTSVTEIRAALERARGRARAAAADGTGDRVGELVGMYSRLIDTYEGHLQSLRALEVEKEQLLATGEHLVGILEGFPADVVRLQCGRLAAVDEGAAQSSIENAAAVRQSLSALEAALREA